MLMTTNNFREGERVDNGYTTISVKIILTTTFSEQKKNAPTPQKQQQTNNKIYKKGSHFLGKFSYVFCSYNSCCCCCHPVVCWPTSQKSATCTIFSQTSIYEKLGLKHRILSFHHQLHTSIQYAELCTYYFGGGGKKRYCMRKCKSNRKCFLEL